MDARIILFFIAVSFGLAFLGAVFYETLNQRLFIPMARWLRFKIDDTENVGKEVNKILGEDDEKTEAKGKKKNAKNVKK